VYVVACVVKLLQLFYLIIYIPTTANVQLSPRSKRHHGDERYVIALEGLIGIGKSTLCMCYASLLPQHSAQAITFLIHRQQVSRAIS